jgi:hypothetical protein
MHDSLTLFLCNAQAPYLSQLLLSLHIFLVLCISVHSTPQSISRMKGSISFDQRVEIISLPRYTRRFVYICCLESRQTDARILDNFQQCRNRQSAFLVLISNSSFREGSNNVLRFSTKTTIYTFCAAGIIWNLNYQSCTVCDETVVSSPRDNRLTYTTRAFAFQ